MLDTLHPSLRGAIQAGWGGLTLVEDDDEGSLVLVCATPAARATARQGPCLGVRRAPAPRDGGLIVLSMEAAGTGTLELGVDLSYAGGRALALRLADDPALRVLLVGPDDGEPPVAARVCLREEARGMLRRAVATAGEWRITDPVPDDPAAGDSLPRLAPAPGDPGVALHVPIERLPGLTDGKGIEITLEDRHGLSPSLLVRPRGDARAEPLRLTLGCRLERALAARAARSGRMRIVGVVPGDECFRAWGEGALRESARDALRQAALIDPATRREC